MKIKFTKNPIPFGFAYAKGEVVEVPEGLGNAAIEAKCAELIVTQEPESESTESTKDTEEEKDEVTQEPEVKGAKPKKVGKTKVETRK